MICHTQRGVILKERLVNLAKLLLALAGLFYINALPYATIVASIAGIVFVILYLWKLFCNDDLYEVYDWSLVYPELAGIETDYNSDDLRCLRKEISELKAELESVKGQG